MCSPILITLYFLPGKENRGNLYAFAGRHNFKRARRKGTKVTLRPADLPLSNGKKVTCIKTGNSYRIYGLTYIKTH